MKQDIDICIDNNIFVCLSSVAKEEDEVPADVVQLCRETFKKTAEYLHGELEGNIIITGN